MAEMRASLRVGVLSALTAGAASAAWAAAPDAPFDRDEVAVDNTDFMLLTEKGYSFDAGASCARPTSDVSRKTRPICGRPRSRRRLADLLNQAHLDRSAAQGP